MIAILAALILQSSTFHAAEERDYLYLDCGSSRTGFEENGCFTLSIKSDLSAAWTEDNGLPAIPSSPQQKDFLVFDSQQLPIAIPRNSYEKKDSWKYRDFRFTKVRRNFSEKILNVAFLVDVINVAKGDVRVLSFWYAKDKGVLAITFLENGPRSGSEIFYCSVSPCLFAAQTN